MGYCYVRRSAPYSDPFLGTTRQFFDDFYRKYHQVYPDDGTVTNAVAGGMAFMKAIQNAGVTPPLTEDKRIKVRDELVKLDIVTAAGAVNFDPTGHNRDITITVTQVQKGKVVSVFPLLLTFGLSLIISNVALLAWKGDYRLVNPSYAAVNLRVGYLTVPYILLATFLFALAAIAGLYFLLQKTDIGRAIRATAQNKDGDRPQGVSPASIYAVIFGLGAGVTAIAGSLLSMSFSIFPSMGGDYRHLHFSSSSLAV
jgi:hypothetical protein